MFWKLRVPFFCTLVLACAAARAATLDVGPGQAYATIQSAIDAAGNGDTVLVQPGTYTENIDFHGKAITVTSSGGPTVTIIDGGGNAGLGTVNFQSGESRSSVISSFTIRNGGGQTYPFGPGGGVNVSFAAPTVLNNIITANECSDVLSINGAALIQDNTITNALAPTSGYPCTFPSAGVLISGDASIGSYSHTQLLGNTVAYNAGASGGIVLNATAATIVQGNVIHDNKGNNAGGLYSINTDAVQILQNIFYANVDSNFGSGAHPSDIYVLAPYSTVGPFQGIIADNTITGNLYIDGNLAQFVVVNNIIAGTSGYPPLTCDPGPGTLAITPPSYDHNDIYNANGAAYSGPCPVQAGAYGNISADPLFVNAGGNDYRLSAGSQAIDAGNNSAPWITSIDFAGSARIQNATGNSYAVVDMGAYEFPGQADGGHTEITLTPSEYFASANPNPAPPPLSFTVTLASAAGQPMGNVSLLEDGSPFGTVSVGSSGTATFSGGNLGTGLHAFTATYAAPTGGPGSPPAFDTPAVSVKFFLLLPNTTPVIAATATQLTCAPPSIPAAGMALLSATVTAAGATPTGTVNFTDNGTALGSAPLTAAAAGAGSATWNYSSLIAGTHTLTASYLPGTGFLASVGACTETVTLLPTTSSLAIVQPSSAAGKPVQLIARVAPVTPLASPLPTGSVTFSQIFPPTTQTLLLGTGRVGAGGVATLTLSTPAPGFYDIACTYSGDQTFAGSSCPVQLVTVNPGATGLTLTPSANPAAVGVPILFTMQLTFNGQASPAHQALTLTYNPTGTAQIVVPLVTDANGMATYRLPAGLAPGSYLFTAAFAGTGIQTLATASVTEVVSGVSDFALSGPAAMNFLTTTDTSAPLTLASVGGFTADVAVACSAAIPQYVCSVTPATVTLPANGNAGATLTLHWVGMAHAERGGRARAMLAVLLPVSLLGLLGLRRRRLLGVLCLGVVLSGASACGSAAYPTIFGSYPVTVTAAGTGAGAGAATTHTLSVTAQIVQ